MTVTATPAEVPSGWSVGLSTLLRREVKRWLRSRGWIVRALLWAGIAILMGLTQAAEAMREGAPVIVTPAVASIGTLLVPLAAIIIAASSIVGERDDGVAAWLLSKPVSRAAYVVAKVVTAALMFLVVDVAVPALAVFAIALVVGEQLNVVNYLVLCAVLWLLVVYWHSLALMVSAVFGSRDVALATGIGLVLAGNALSGLALQLLGEPLGPLAAGLMPWSISFVLPGIVGSGVGALQEGILPFAALTGWTLFNYVVTIREVGQLEF